QHKHSSAGPIPIPLSLSVPGSGLKSSTAIASYYSRGLLGSCCVVPGTGWWCRSWSAVPGLLLAASRPVRVVFAGGEAMGSGRVFSVVASVVLLWLGVAAAQGDSPWKTLSGNAPAIIAKGGFSGLFPDSSEFAYQFAMIASSPDTILYCDVRLTKDGLGVCLPDIKMDNCTNIPDFYPKGKKSYLVNGVSTTGWFSVDYNGTELSQVSLKQSIFSRTPRFDPSFFPLLAVEDVASKFKPPGMWLNIQHDGFYSQFNMSMRKYILSVSRRVIVDYISSPEASFLTSISGRVSNNTKLVFRFLDEATLEPSTKETYGSMLKNLTFIKTFASGILVPKKYIWPVSPDNYLQPYTSIVDDAHKAGLEIYAADFANDFALSYNHSYDPLAESLSFIDNGAFSVDGILTDFPVTPSEAIGCFANLNKSNTDHGMYHSFFPSFSFFMFIHVTNHHY
uniref:glycerophosphodiester phosphodiesterase n=2 Tax=Aegilops tauschii subsp. strangulata TaxID=200361 RepID=A0A453C6S8_AEGTS